MNHISSISQYKWTIVVVLLALFSPSKAVAEVSKAAADSAYAREHFAEAARQYRSIIDSVGESSQLYYNIGNCYYRMDSMARAILYYERALLLDPSDRDVRFNLDMARAHTVDKVVPASEMFFVSLFNRLILSLSINQWAAIAIAAFVLALCLLMVYLFVPNLTAKKAGFALSVVALVVTVFANIAAFRQRVHIEHRTGAVVMTPSAVVKSTPSRSGTDLFILHEGTHVDIIDDTMREWVEVHVADGKEGWLSRSEIETI